MRTNGKNGGNGAKRGRKCAITPEVTELLKEALSVGASKKDACAYAGISHTPFYEKINADPEFAEEMMRARRAGITTHLKFIAADKDWRARAHLLAIFDRERYSVRQKHEHSGNVTVSVADFFTKASERHHAALERN